MARVDNDITVDGVSPRPPGGFLLMNRFRLEPERENAEYLEAVVLEPTIALLPRRNTRRQLLQLLEISEQLAARPITRDDIEFDEGVPEWKQRLIWLTMKSYLVLEPRGR